jgi:hypothetical protein
VHQLSLFIALLGIERDGRASIRVHSSDDGSTEREILALVTNRQAPSSKGSAVRQLPIIFNSGAWPPRCELRCDLVHDSIIVSAAILRGSVEVALCVENRGTNGVDAIGAARKDVHRSIVPSAA